MECNSNRHPWASLDSSPPLCDNMMSLFDFDFSNDTSFWSQVNQESTDAWMDVSEIPDSTFLDINFFNDMDLNQCFSPSPRDGPHHPLNIEDANFDPFVECPAIFPHGTCSSFPGSSSADSQVPNPWDPLSSQSPCSESLYLSPVSPGPMFTPPALAASPTVSDLTMEFLSSTEVVIPDFSPCEPTIHPLPQVPERCPNNGCHGQQTQPFYRSARERRRYQRPEKCPVCHKGHQYKSDMHKHIRTQHREYAKWHGIAEDPFICDMCGKSYSRSDRLYRHKVNKHGWPPRMKRC